MDPHTLKLFAVVNPAAGSRPKSSLANELQQACQDLIVGIHLTTPGDNYKAIVKKAKARGANGIVVAGGDGTMCLMATAMIGTGLRLIVMPAGTANVLAKSLGQPRNPAELRKLVDDSTTIYLDAFKVRDRYFFSHVSVGAYSKIAQATPARSKQRFGRLAYIYSGFKTLLGKSRWRFYLNVDGKPMSFKASTILTANIGELGAGGLEWTKNASPCDGKGEICVIRSESFSQYLRLFFEIVAPWKDKKQQIQFVNFHRRLLIRTKRSSVPVRGDGEIIGRTPLDLQLKPGVLPMIVSKAKKLALDQITAEAV